MDDATNASGHEILEAAGTIDVYRGKAGSCGIDACLPLALAVEMLAALPPKAAAELYVYQPDENGMVAIDVEVPAPLAARLLTAAEKHAGAIIRR